MKAAVRLLLILALVAPAFASAQTAPAPVPTCKLFTSATTVNYNTKVRLDWTTTNVTSGYLNEVGAIPPNGFAFVVPGKNTTYTASFAGPGGTVVCRVGIVVRASTPAGGGGVNGGGTIDTTANPIDTNRPVNLDRPVNLNVPNVTLPTVQTVAPATNPAGGGGLLSGIVPAECRSGPPGTDPLNTVKNCDICAMGQMAQNIINFLLGLTIPAAALLFAWAGILFFSSRGVPEQINRAKKIFKTVVIGFVIAVSAWLLVNTVIQMLVTGTAYQDGSWKSLNCTATRILRQQQIQKTIGEYLTSSLPGLQSYTPPVGGTAYQCVSGTLQNGKCVNAEGAVIGTPVLVNTANSGTAGGALGCSQYGAGGGGYSVAGTQCVDNETLTVVGPALRPGQLTDAQLQELVTRCAGDEFATADQASCDRLNAVQAVVGTGSNASGGVRRWNTEIAQACVQASMGDCRVVQAIMTHESGGNCNLISNAGAVGCMQLMPTTACGVDRSLAGCSTCTDWNYNKGPNCAEVRQALLSDPARNIQIGTQELSRLYNKYSGDVASVAAGYNGGDRANLCGSDCMRECGGGAAWQCTAFAGYRETRVYVPRVVNTLNNLK